jgi:hypothetical protein
MTSFRERVGQMVVGALFGFARNALRAYAHGRDTALVFVRISDLSGQPIA